MATATKSAKTETKAVAGVGRIARVTGPVVDIEFPHDSIPGIYNALKTTITIGKESTELNDVVALVFGQQGLIAGASLAGVKYTRIIP